MNVKRGLYEGVMLLTTLYGHEVWNIEVVKINKLNLMAIK